MNAKQLWIGMLIIATPAIAHAGIFAVPEPETLPLLAVGVLALIIARLRKRK